MPPARRSRSSNGPAAKGGQTTLSFGNQSKITKSTTKTGKLIKDVDLLKPEILEAEVQPDTGHTTSEAAVQDQAQVELAKPRTKEEIEAEKITDARLKKYWKAKEAERRAPRVHQKDLSLEEKILREFDISSQFGPCIGMARMRRWTRANKLGLNPPLEVLAVLLREENKGNNKVERAHIDELLSLSAITGEA